MFEGQRVRETDTPADVSRFSVIAANSPFNSFGLHVLSTTWKTVG